MRLNNKGYMLVEIIVAAVIAMGVAYYLINLTYKFKDQNMDIYNSTYLLSDKINVTKNIMTDLETKNITEVKKCGDKCVEFSDDEENVLRLMVGDDKVLEYGKYISDYVKSDSSYYKKQFSNTSEVGSFNINDNYVIIPITDIYSDYNYDIIIMTDSGFNDTTVNQIYTITFDKQGGTGGTDYIYLALGIGVGKEYKNNSLSNIMSVANNPIVKPTKTGYTFNGYYEGTVTTIYSQNVASSNNVAALFWCADDIGCYGSSNSITSFYYSDTYTFDTLTGKYTLTNPTLVSFNDADAVYGSNLLNEKYVCVTGNSGSISGSPTKSCIYMYYVVDFDSEEYDSTYDDYTQNFVVKKYSRNSNASITYGTQMIDGNGYITNNFTNDKYNANTTLYAKWVNS